MSVCNPCVEKRIRKDYIAHVYKLRYMGFEPLSYKEFRDKCAAPTVTR